jgi:hypothetical protein
MVPFVRLNYVRTGSAIMYGAKTFIKKRFSASSFWKDCYKYQITVRKQYCKKTVKIYIFRPIAEQI